MSAGKTEARPIVVVDDSDDERTLLLDRLGRAHLPNAIDVCTEGGEAISRLDACWKQSSPTGWPCLLLLDLHMLVMSGFAVLEWLRGQPDRHGLKVVIVSNSTDPAEMDRAKALGADAFLIKVPSVACLEAIVHTASLAAACASRRRADAGMEAPVPR